MNVFVLMYIPYGSDSGHSCEIISLHRSLRSLQLAMAKLIKNGYDPQELFATERDLVLDRKK